jgi:hypothetical protein
MIFFEKNKVCGVEPNRVLKKTPWTHSESNSTTYKKNGSSELSGS